MFAQVKRFTDTWLSPDFTYVFTAIRSHWAVLCCAMLTLISFNTTGEYLVPDKRWFCFKNWVIYFCNARTELSKDTQTSRDPDFCYSFYLFLYFQILENTAVIFHQNRQFFITILMFFFQIFGSLCSPIKNLNSYETCKWFVSNETSKLVWKIYCEFLKNPFF